MLRIAAQTLQEIKARASIAEVIGSVVQLKRKGVGETWWGCCPFHQERTPSFVVHADRGFYKCFGCGAKGDLVTFVREHYNLGYLEAMRYLAEQCGVAWEEVEEDPRLAAEAQEQEGLYILMEVAKEYFRAQLAEAGHASNYLKSRGIGLALQEKFQLGYSPKGWQSLYSYAEKKGYEVAMLTAAGLVVEREGTVYDRFHDRIIFPITDSLGRVVGFGGRKIEGTGAKYLNSPETVLYQKSKVLFGLFQAREAIRQAGQCYLVEGYTDVLALHEAGLPQVVAASGTALTEGQVQLLKRFTQRVTLVLDSDEAGQRATLRSLDLLLQSGMEPRVVTLPAGSDPASYLRDQGSKALLDYLEREHQDFVSFSFGACAPKGAADPETKAAVVRAIVERISLIPEEIRQSSYLEVCSRVTGVDLYFLQASLQRLLAHKPVTSFSAKRLPNPRKAAGRTPFQREEEVLVYLLLQYGSYPMDGEKRVAAYLFEELEEFTFRTSRYGELFERFREAWKREGGLTTKEFLESQPEEVKAEAIDLLAAHYYTVSPRWGTDRGVVNRSVEEAVGELVYKNVLRLKLKVVRALLQETVEGLRSEQTEAGLEEKLAACEALDKLKASLAQKLGTAVFP